MFLMSLKKTAHKKYRQDGQKFKQKGVLVYPPSHCSASLSFSSVPDPGTAAVSVACFFTSNVPLSSVRITDTSRMPQPIYSRSLMRSPYSNASHTLRLLPLARTVPLWYNRLRHTQRFSSAAYGARRHRAGVRRRRKNG